LSFFSGNINILVCTTIIESGLDVTNANTIIINNAQDFGLSQLYQIRGRVGRGRKQAVCLLVIPKRKLLRDAHLRLKALEENNALGSGYYLSVRDLEIRGAGSLFGYKQSGNVSKVGFELYCEMLEEEINIEKNEFLASNTFSISADCLLEIVEDYIKDRSIRLDFYFRLSKIKDMVEFNIVKKDILNRYGRLPKPTERLFNIAQIKILFKKTCVDVIRIKDKSLSLTLGGIGNFKTLNILFNTFDSFKSENFKSFRYKKDTLGNLMLYFSIDNIDQAFIVLFEMVPLFNNG
jgi:transcription-repair coupling factor (superfamily II helicase)